MNIGEMREEMENVEKQASEELNMPKVPAEVERWNNYLKQKNFDPFDRVVLVKGIDNSILTSFRTLKGDNNTVSDTFKIVHKKFQPSRPINTFYKNMITRHVDKLPYQTQYNINEEDEEYAGEYEIFEEKEDGKFEKIVMPDQRST